jgi:K+-transporting ATPase c subunit
MAVSNPFEQRVIDLQMQINALSTEISNVTNTRNAEYAREQAFANAGNYGAEYREASAAYNAALRRLDVLNAEKAALQDELAAAKANRDRVAAAAAQAVANGLDPESAMQKAVADTERAQGTKRLLTYVGLGLLVLIVVAAVVYWRKKRKG